MIEELINDIRASLTPYHTVERVKTKLLASNFVCLEEKDEWHLEKGKGYFVIRDGSALIAFYCGREDGGFRIVASHTDSPCLKIKGAPETNAGGCTKLNTEPYGGGIYYSLFDRPLTIAGRIVQYNEKTRVLEAKTVADTHKCVIPSLAIHFNREVNKGASINPQKELSPLVSAFENFKIPDFADPDCKTVASDLFLVNGDTPTLVGQADEMLLSPRLDNLTSVFSSVSAIQNAGECGVSLAYLADNEEVGSKTKQGAGSDFLSSVLHRICNARGKRYEEVLPDTFLISCDNAHAVHPNHPEKSDPTNPVVMGKGIVIKYHANQNYTTDAFSAAIFKTVMEKAALPYQEFYMRADMPCGSTLGAISSAQVSCRSLDIGIGQLAMHSANETLCVADYETMVKALTAFYRSNLKCLTGTSVQL